MFKSTLRVAAGPSLSRAIPRQHAARRFISTAPPHQKSRSWRNSAARWGLAGALVYYYNAANTFAEEPQCMCCRSAGAALPRLTKQSDAVHAPPETSHERETMATVESVSEQRRARARKEAPPRSSQEHQTTAVAAAPDAEQAAPGSPEALEEEADQQGAFNEETGEINWDCPCLGGMAYGPCGEQFRAAFSCFVFSKEEPKGVDCIENFKNMQNCFRDHPDVYGSELEDDDEPAEGQEAAVKEEANKPADHGAAKSAESPTGSGSRYEASQQQAIDSTPPASNPAEQAPSSSPPGDVKQSVSAEDAEETLVPRSWHDSR